MVRYWLPREKLGCRCCCPLLQRGDYDRWRAVEADKRMSSRVVAKARKRREKVLRIDCWCQTTEVSVTGRKPCFLGTERRREVNRERSAKVVADE